MKNINIYENSSVDMVAAVIADELTKKGEITIHTKGGAEALDRAIQSVNMAKACMNSGEVTLGKAISHMGDTTLLLRKRNGY